LQVRLWRKSIRHAKPLRKRTSNPMYKSRAFSQINVLFSTGIIRVQT
jgi:hypothetical protein